MSPKFNFDTEKNDNDLDQFTIDKDDEPKTLTLSELLEIQKSNISEDIEYLKELKRGIEKEEKSKKSPKIDEEKYNTRTKNTTKTESKKSKQKKNNSYNNINNIKNMETECYLSIDIFSDEIYNENDININENKKQRNNLIGKKRSLKNEVIEEFKFKSNQEIFKEIKNLFDTYNQKYNKNNEMIPSYKIFEEYDGDYKRATVVENKIPGCIIYFDKNIITNIYLIREQSLLEEEDKISEVLQIVKDNMLKQLKA